MNTTKENSTSRPPIIAIMGHIDHGKSTLLDYIRKTNIVEKEAGGITQRISAYEVVHTDSEGIERRITFLDTPGHEAFQAMRERGASIADIAVLIVSAEDGVKPQTLEALRAIQEAKLPFVVAINKIDKPAADIPRTKQSLAEHEVFVEGYGGSIPVVEISAKAGTGVDALLDTLLLVSDLEHFTMDSKISAEGFVLESNMDPKRGATATLVLKNGTLSKGGFVVAGDALAPLRIVENFLGKAIQEALPSAPVRVAGWNHVPKVGEKFTVIENKKQAEEKAREATSSAGQSEHKETHNNNSGTAIIPLIIKADTEGGAEAVMHELRKEEQETVKIKLISSGAGSITENDVKLLSGIQGGVIVGFNVAPDARAQELSERQGVTIATFDIIYKLREWFAALASERRPRVTTEEVRGVVRVLKTFSRTKDRQIIGGRVEEGKVVVGDRVKIMRREAEIEEGKIVEVQMQKSKVREAAEGSECGLLVEAKLDIAPGDRLRSIALVEK